LIALSTYNVNANHLELYGGGYASAAMCGDLLHQQFFFGFELTSSCLTARFVTHVRAVLEPKAGIT
jgi:hypothetical protein